MRGEHKGQNGRVLIVGGSKDYVGCLALAGLAALRTGVDLVKIAAPERVAWAINAYSPDLITIKLAGEYLEPSHLSVIEDLAGKSDVILMGTGAGTRKETKSLFERLAGMKMPKVIDADGLKMIDATSVKNAVLTPHIKEYEAAFGESPTRESLLRFGRPDRVIVLKGEVDLISNGSNIYENRTGNSGMTVGGTGDTLAGIIAGLISQGKDLLDAARLGASINGVAGDLAFKKFGNSLIASDLIDLIPEAMKHLKIKI